MNNFKPGDVVKLLTSGPWMTVSRVEERVGGTVICLWFEGSTLHTGVFEQPSLVKRDSEAA